eukprot:TRINITY_DN23197_c0_g1_i1.p1 TRINITY_DN23197_c0_g1~~TRINITY_DN23197_c0_g1_i1.p1  ORF type:complete len:124 (+),score=26.06 TRINITY_DN23197_c0_g1_i1:168-539(+)
MAPTGDVGAATTSGMQADGYVRVLPRESERGPSHLSCSRTASEHGRRSSSASRSNASSSQSTSTGSGSQQRLPLSQREKRKIVKLLLRSAREAELQQVLQAKAEKAEAGRAAALAALPRIIQL